MTSLVIAPHADDEVIGMGGTIAKLVRQGEEVVVAVLTGHGKDPHPIWPQSMWQTVRSECRAAAKILGVSDVVFRELPAACLDVLPAWEVNRTVDEILKQYQPKDVYCCFPHDLHKDHGAIAYAVNVATRPYLEQNFGLQRVLYYETLSETHLAAPYLAPAFQPNIFVNIEDTIELKLAAMAAYESQLQPDPKSRSLFALRALAATRGAQIASTAAEAFVLSGQYVR